MKYIMKECPWSEQERLDYMDIIKQINTHKQKFKAAKLSYPWKDIKEKAARNKLREEWLKTVIEPKAKKIKALRESLKEYGMMFYAVKLIVGKEIIIEGWYNEPINVVEPRRDKKDRATILRPYGADNEEKAKPGIMANRLRELFQKIRADRQASKHIMHERKDLLGYRYSVVKNVFTKPGSVLALKGTVQDDDRLNSTKKPLGFKKDKYVGIEIEFICQCSQDYLADLLIDAKLQSYVQIKSDSSIQADETHKQRFEVVMMATENEIADIVTRTCNVLHSKRVNAKANDSCGLHVHLDMRFRDVHSSYEKLYKSQNILMNMLPHMRREGDRAERYCKRNVETSYEKQRALPTKDGGHDRRYYVINAEAYNKYKTLEVRCHSGTTNATKIINWVAILTGIVNHNTVPEASFKSSVDNFCSFFGINDSLKTYIEARTKKFQDASINTNKDESEAA